MKFSELCITTNFTFLFGASHPEEYVRKAFELGLKSIALTDINSVAGVVRGHRELLKIKENLSESQIDFLKAKDENKKGSPFLKLIPGSCLIINNGIFITAIPLNKHGWSELCSLLSTGYRRSKKGECNINLEEVLNFSKELNLLLHPPKNLNLPFYKNVWLKNAEIFSANCKKATSLYLLIMMVWMEFISKKWWIWAKV